MFEIRKTAYGSTLHRREGRNWIQIGICNGLNWFRFYNLLDPTTRLWRNRGIHRIEKMPVNTARSI